MIGMRHGRPIGIRRALDPVSPRTAAMLVLLLTSQLRAPDEQRQRRCGSSPAL